MNIFVVPFSLYTLGRIYPFLWQEIKVGILKTFEVFCCSESYLTFKALTEQCGTMGPELRTGHVTLGKSFTRLGLHLHSAELDVTQG